MIVLNTLCVGMYAVMCHSDNCKLKESKKKEKIMIECRQN